MAEKVTMKLKVDLGCEKCHRKVKKLLAKYPQIRDQEFDEKENIVTITVECCSPEKIRDKLCCKGGCCIRSIEIVEPKPPPQDVEKPNHELELDLKLKLKLEIELEPKPPPFGTCCGLCSEGRSGGPCGNGCAGPLVCFCYGGYYRRPVCNCYGGGRPYYVCHCSQYYYFSEENTSSCIIM